MNTQELIDRIFKEPGVKYELTEFVNLGKPIHKILTTYEKIVTKGKDAGKKKYFVKSLVPFASGAEEVQVYVEGGKSAPEEIVRQLWVYKLLNEYQYKPDEIDLEKSVHFGTEVSAKAADIIVYTDATKSTPKIIVEVKKPKRKDGIEQLKSYMNSKGAPTALWSNGSDSIILYRPYPHQYDDTLTDLPKRGQQPKDVLQQKKVLSQLKKNFNFKKIVQDLEELVLADSGKDEFNEIFKLIFAKIWDEKEAAEERKDQVVEFRKALDADITYDRINSLFHSACEEWPGIFKEGEDIELAKRHLQVCVGPIENVRLLGSNLRIMDDAFEYLLPTEAKKKKGQFFTPRHVVEMCVRMLNPNRKDYVMDPACGSGGFLLHAMDWCYPAATSDDREKRKHKYAAKYLWGIDFEQRAAKTSRALMLIAGDGHTNIFGPDVSSLEPRTWFENASGQALMHGLRANKLTAKTIPEAETLTDDDKAWDYFNELKFDLVLANPPFAGEMKDRKMLVHYDLAKPALRRAGDNRAAKEERDVLFIERILKMLKPGGRAAIVLPQGKFNNSSLGFIREWILQKARLLAVVGLHPNTFKPHTGTKTSVLFIQRYTKSELDKIAAVHDEVASKCPNYQKQIESLLKKYADQSDVPGTAIPEDIQEFLAETFDEHADEDEDGEVNGDPEPQASSSPPPLSEAEQIDAAKEQVSNLRDALTAIREEIASKEAGFESFIQDEDAKLASNIASIADAKARSTIKRELKAAHKALIGSKKASFKEEMKGLRAEAQRLASTLEQAEFNESLLTNAGKLRLLLADSELLGVLAERWIAAAVAKRLDYPIFMAVSDRGGKDSSGDYLYVLDAKGSLVEFPAGHPQEGLLVIDQDLVNYDLQPNDLKNASKVPDDQIRIAEAFIRFAQEQKFSFWTEA